MAALIHGGDQMVHRRVNETNHTAPTKPREKLDARVSGSEILGEYWAMGNWSPGDEAWIQDCWPIEQETGGKLHTKLRKTGWHKELRGRHNFRDLTVEDQGI